MASDPDPHPRRNVEPGNGADPTKHGPSEFERFKALAGKLVQVPKKELDAKRNESKPKSPGPSVRRT